MRNARIDYNDFARYMQNYMKPSEKTAEDMFKELVEEEKLDDIGTIESLPPEIFKRHKYKLLANLQDGRSYKNVIVRKTDGKYSAMYIDDAFEQGYDIIFPQDRSDFYKLVDNMIKSIDEEADSGYWNAMRRAEDVAERVYGENWKNKIAYLKKKGSGQAVSESEQLGYEEAA